MTRLLFDIGGTKTRITRSTDQDSFEAPITYQTPQNYDEAILEFVKNAEEVLQGTNVSSICGGIPGPLNDRKSKVQNAPNLPDWSHKPIRSDLESHFQTKVYLENDSALSALGEAVYGSAKGKSIVGYITISTGVGGARIVDENIDRSAFGFEPGHQIINNGKSLENLVSGSALRKKYSQSSKDITDEKVWDEVTDLLSIGLTNTILHWSPNILVLGGAVTQKLSLEKLKSKISEKLTIFPALPILSFSQHKDQSGLYGALALLNKKETSS